MVNVRWLGVVGLAGALGCSVMTGFSGLTGSADDAGTTADAAQASDAAHDATSSTLDAGLDANGPCVAATTMSNAFDKDAGTFLSVSTVMGYPQVEPFFGDPALVILPFRDTSLVDAGPDAAPMPKEAELTSVRSAAWLPAPVPLTSFDVTFQAQVRCTSAISCGDGLIFAWLDTVNPDLLDHGGTGHTAGLPELVGGAGVNIDDYQNGPSETNDPYTPSLQIVQLDPAQKVGTYPWQKAIEKLNFFDAWHTYTVRQRGGAVTVFYDGTMQLSANVTRVKKGFVGLTAGTGSDTDAIAVRNFQGTFYDCVAP